ncbi:MAG: peptide ABC transporter substrate-binding protein [Clostridiaceae bacterium]|nr:peptide ABC transporter substrate-binding protein [Clostridiaceae bacterium]
MNKKILLTIISISISILLTSCVALGIREENNQNKEYNFLDSEDDVIDMGPTKGGVLRLYSTIPDTLNPILTNNIYVRDYSEFIFESLTKLDKSQKAVPVLAKSWEVSEDTLTWTFHVKEDIHWHDNMPFTAEDVEFTLNAIINSPNSSYKTNVSNITTFTVVDQKTFRIVLGTPNSFTAELMTFPILPKHYFFGEDFLTSAKNNTPIGTGPYKFSEFSPGQFVKLKSNENWWKAEQDDKALAKLPYIEEIEICLYEKTKIGSDAFQGGDIDVLTIDRSLWSKYNGRQDIVMKRYTTNNFEYIAFNLSNKILKLPEVRQAIAYAVDKTKIINDILPGEAVASDLPLMPDTWLNDTNAVFYSTDKEKARKLLEDSGWKESNGLLYKRINGANTALKLELLVNEDNSLRVKVAEEIKNQLKEIGIELTIKKQKWEDELKSLDKNRFDMVFIGCQVTSIPDLSFMYSSETGTLNLSSYSNIEVDEYLKKIMSEKNEELKKEYYLKMKELINQDLPYLGLYFYNDAVVYSKKIKGEFNPYLWNRYFDLVQWYIPIT